MASQPWPPDIEAAADEYDAPVELDVAALMDIEPRGTKRDEVGRDPAVDGNEFDHGDAPVVGVCETCGHELHACEADGVGPVTGHGCSEGFRMHRDGEGIRLTGEADPWGDG